MGLNITVLAVGDSNDFKALEQALLLKDENLGSKVSVVAVDACASGFLREAMLRGADEVTVLENLVPGGCDIAVCGSRDVDEMARLAQMLKLELVVGVRAIRAFSSGNFAVECIVGGEVEEACVVSPAFVAVDSSAAPCRPRNAFCLLRYNRKNSSQELCNVLVNSVQQVNVECKPKECKNYPPSDEGIKALVNEVLRGRVLQVTDSAKGLKESAVVVAGGYGVGSKGTFDKLFELARLLNGEVGATRAAIDAGYTTRDRMIGQTGVAVHPELYIAFGLSGHAQHVSGIRDCGVMISVNNDPYAPINSMADYVVIGDAKDIIDKFITCYQQQQ